MALAETSFARNHRELERALDTARTKKAELRAIGATEPADLLNICQFVLFFYLDLS